MSWSTLVKLIPILAGIASPGVGQLAGQLIGIAEAEIQRRMTATGKTRDEVLQEAAVQWQANIDNAQALADLGHENEPPPVQ
jgi:hypothetical protein